MHIISQKKWLLGAAIISVSVLAIVFIIVQRHVQNVIDQARLKNRILGMESQNKNQTTPIRLVIPKIGVDTAIESVGLTPNDEMGVPSNIDSVGWFDLGPRPGEPGSSVIDGHLDGKNSEKGVFYNIYKLRAGDNIYVTDSKGITSTFVVTGNRTYNPGYVSEVFSSSSGSHLNLITCDGTWDGVKKSFSKRLVVFADIVN